MLPKNVVRISENADAINKTLVLLKQELQKMKTEIVQRMLAKDGRENEQLKTEVELWKNKLIQAEIKNGKKQFSVQAEVQEEAIAAGPKKTPPAATVQSETKEQQKVDKTAKKAAPKQQPKTDTTATETVDVSRLDFRIGRIIGVQKHPDADSLYVEEVETGEERPRTVVSGLVKHVPIEEMQNRPVVLLCNLKPAKMRGVLSEAMVMCASTPDKVEILIPPNGCVPGDRIQFEGFPGEPDQQLNPKKKIFEQLAPDLKTDGNRVATFKGVAFTVVGKGIVTAPTLAGAPIK